MIRGVGTFFAVILGLQILFVLIGANTANALVRFIGEWARLLALWFHNLFNTGNFKLDIIMNYGLAIVFWLVVTGLLARLVNRTA
ncbi:MAG TPA: hypothetical protein VGD67_01055 [Pseudonocardiaceae bacterium]